MATAKKTPQAAIAAAAVSTAQAPGAPASGDVRQVLQVIAKRDGFRRAGREWHGTTTVPLNELTAYQYEQLTNEPMLVTLMLEVPADQVGELTDPSEGIGT